MIVVPIWVALCLVTWFVVSFPTGVLIGRYLRDHETPHPDPRLGTPTPDHRTI